ncbi:hypothetical protein [Paraburkholderia sp. 40]|uniref:hypothetical protein n=1 Tax=Paraburkholderia sp. 40 TaxID=2991059 RepID=UPI003D1F1348
MSTPRSVTGAMLAPGQAKPGTALPAIAENLRVWNDRSQRTWGQVDADPLPLLANADTYDESVRLNALRKRGSPFLGSLALPLEILDGRTQGVILPVDLTLLKVRFQQHTTAVAISAAVVGTFVRDRLFA